VNVISLEGGYCMVLQSTKNKILTILTLQREFMFEMQSEHEVKQWQNVLSLVLSKQIKQRKYKKQVKEQEIALSNINKVNAYFDI